MSTLNKDNIIAEKKFEEILNNLDVGFYQGVFKGKILMHNVAINNMLGLDPSESLIGKSSSQFFTRPGDQQKYFDELERNGQIQDFITKLKKPNGDIIYVQINAHLVKENDKIPLKVEGTVINITEKYFLEQKLKESEEKYRLILENANDLISIFNEKFKIDYLNENAHYNILGYSKEFIRENNPFSLIHPDDAEKIIKSFQAGFIKGESSGEYRIRNKDGNYVWLESRGKTFLEKNGKKRAILISRDISEKKKVEQELREYERTFKMITDNSNDLIAILNQNFEHIYINENAYYSVLGYKKEEVLGKRSRDFAHPDDIKRVSRSMKNGLIKGELLEEFRTRHKNGHYIWIELKGKFLIEDGEIIGAILISRDITERQETEQKLRESEEKYRSLVEDAQEGIWALDEKENTIFVNSRICEMLGYTKNEMIDRNLHSFLPETMNALIRGNRSKREKGIKETYEAQIVKKDGTNIYTEVRAAPIMDKNLNYKGSFAYITDITERKSAVQKIQESENKYRTLFESSTDGIYSTDIEGNFIEVNEAFLKMIGYSRENLLVMHNRQITPPKWYETEDNNLFTQLSAGESKVYEKEFIHKNGNILPVSIRFWILHDEQGDPFRIWAIIRDITERKQMEQELKEINRLKSEFLRRASHELKTPLVSIKGFSELILSNHSEDLDPVIISNLEEINRGCNRLQIIINDLLDSSRLESIEIKPRLEKEDLSFLINYCAEELHPLAAKREQSINIEIPDSIVTRFEKEEIYEVLSNLLTNAIKYTPPRGWIDIKTELTKDFVIVSIKDNGIGFTEEEKEKIFKQFGKIERYGQGLDLGIGGTGLGLYISKKIIESHGGEIWMESKGKDNGSTFYFSLPLIKD